MTKPKRRAETPDYEGVLAEQISKADWGVMFPTGEVTPDLIESRLTPQIEALFAVYGIERSSATAWRDLALKLACAHVDGFRRSTRGAPPADRSDWVMMAFWAAYAHRIATGKGSQNRDKIASALAEKDPRFAGKVNVVGAKRTLHKFIEKHPAAQAFKELARVRGREPNEMVIDWFQKDAHWNFYVDDAGELFVTPRNEAAP